MSIDPDLLKTLSPKDADAIGEQIRAYFSMMVDQAMYLFENGTDADWGALARMHRPGPRVCWTNPPFSNGNLKRWVTKCTVEAAKHPTLDIVTLLPSDFGTVAGQLALGTCDAMCHVRGRIPFIGPDEQPLPAGAKTATVLVYWGDRSKAFKRLFLELGEVVVIAR